MILNTIIVSYYSRAHNAHTEHTVALIRPYRLTYTGAARILRRTGQLGSGSVVRLEFALIA